MLSVDISPIKETKGASMRADITCDASVLGPLVGDVSYSEPVQVSVDVTNAGSQVVVSGTVKATLTAPCSRCLEPTSFGLSTPIFERFNGLPDDDGVILTSDDDETKLIKGDKVDLTDSVRDAIIMATPMRFLCSDDCAGLCQVCGGNKNVTKCDCTPPLDSRFSALAALLQPKESGE